MNLCKILPPLIFCYFSQVCIADNLQQRFDPKLDYKDKIITWKELHNQGVIRQKLDASCGAAALGTILKYYYGLDVTEEDMMHSAKKKEWFSFADMVTVLEKYNFKGIGLALNFEQLKQIKVPAVVFIKTRSRPHFAVLRSISDSHVVLADPAHGNNRYPIDKFLEKWNTRNDPNYSGKILVPVPLKTAKQLNIKKDYFNQAEEINHLAKKFVRLQRTLLFY